MEAPPQSLHVLLTRLCSQMEAPPQRQEKERERERQRERGPVSEREFESFEFTDSCCGGIRINVHQLL